MPHNKIEDQVGGLPDGGPLVFVEINDGTI